MKKKFLSILCFAAISALTAQVAHSAPTDAEIASLGGELTPVGAQRAGNADGSLPAWSGGTAVPQGIGPTARRGGISGNTRVRSLFSRSTFQTLINMQHGSARARSR